MGTDRETGGAVPGYGEAVAVHGAAVSMDGKIVPVHGAAKPPRDAASALIPDGHLTKEATGCTGCR